MLSFIYSKLNCDYLHLFRAYLAKLNYVYNFSNNTFTTTIGI